MISELLEIKVSKGKGRGVFARVDILANTLLEVAPVLILPKEDCEKIDQTFLYNYYFLWGEKHANYAIALGFGSIYNHSYQPNCVYETYYEDEIIQFITLIDIKAGEELTVNYNGEPTCQDKVWFDK